MVKYETVNSIHCKDWDDAVRDLYNKPYCYQQQDGCRNRGVDWFDVPIKEPIDFIEEAIPEKVNGDEMGVSFAAWLARDPNQPLNSRDSWERKYGLKMFWERNFYPCVEMIFNDLYDQGILPAGKYQILIDW